MSRLYWKTADQWKPPTSFFGNAAHTPWTVRQCILKSVLFLKERIFSLPLETYLELHEKV